MENAKPSTALILPGKQVAMRVSISALMKTAQYIMQNGKHFRPGEFFTITGTDQSKITMWLE